MPTYLLDAKSGFKRLAHQDRHPERSEGSRSEILRCAQNDSPEKFQGKVYQCLEFWFSGLCKRYFINELGADMVTDLFQEVTSTRYILNLAILEVLNAFYRVHREGHLTEAERDAFTAAFYNNITNGQLLVYSVRDDHIF